MEVNKMKKPTIIAVIFFLFLGIGFFAFSMSSSKSNKTTSTDKEAMQAASGSRLNQDQTIEKKDSSMMEVNDDEIMKDTMETSRYIEYSKQNLDKTRTTRRVLFYYASWCPTCRPADEDLRNNANKIPDDVTVIRVNYNDPETDQEEKGLAEKYGVTYQHTFVQIDSEGNEITKWNGGKTNELLSQIK